MQRQGFTEKDWKLFRSKSVGWQEAYMDRLTKEYLEILNGDAAPSTKFWTLEKRLRTDQKKAGVSVEMRRSMLLNNLISLINERAIRFEDLEEFSDELRETIKAFTKRQ